MSVSNVSYKRKRWFCICLHTYCRTGSFTSRRRRLKRSWKRRFLFLTTKDLNICWSSPMAMWRKARSQSKYSMTILLFFHDMNYHIITYNTLICMIWGQCKWSDMYILFAFEGFLPRDGCRRRLHVPDGPRHVLLSPRHMALPQIQVAFYRGFWRLCENKGCESKAPLNAAQGNSYKVKMCLIRSDRYTCVKLVFLEDLPFCN